MSGVVFQVKELSPRHSVGGKPLFFCCDACAGYFAANRERVLALRSISPSK